MTSPAMKAASPYGSAGSSFSTNLIAGGGLELIGIDWIRCGSIFPSTDSSESREDKSAGQVGCKISDFRIFGFSDFGF